MFIGIDRVKTLVNLIENITEPLNTVACGSTSVLRDSNGERFEINPHLLRQNTHYGGWLGGEVKLTCERVW